MLRSLCSLPTTAEQSTLQQLSESVSVAMIRRFRSLRHLRNNKYLIVPVCWPVIPDETENPKLEKPERIGIVPVRIRLERARNQFLSKKSNILKNEVEVKRREVEVVRIPSGL